MNRPKVAFKPLSTAPKTCLILIMTTVLALSASGIKKPPITHAHYGGTLVWGTINPPTIINPVLTSHSVSAPLLSLVFDSLVRIDSDGRIVPGLARSWDISSEGLQYTFHLQPHVYFHDGVECTAEDVKYTIEAIRDPLNQSSWRTDTALIDHLDILDRYTLRIVLKQPSAHFLVRLIIGILPEHLYKGTRLAGNVHNYFPIGTGPFRFQSWKHTTNEIVLTANRVYFEGRPYLDRIVIKTYPDNAALWAALMRGELDLVKFLNRQDYEVLSKDPAFRTYQIPSGTYFAIVYNTHNHLLHDHDLRCAINYAIDRKSLMERAGISGVESNGPFYPESDGFNKKVETASYNPVRARLLLAGRGWKLGNDGLLEKDQEPLMLTMLVNKNRPDCRQMALILRQQLSEVGIGLKVIFYDNENQLTKDYLDRVGAHMWLRMFLGGQNNLKPEDVTRSWYSASSEFGRLWSYQDDGIDRLFEQGLLIKDDRQRAAIYQKIHALVYEDQSACFLFFSVTYHAVAAKVANTEDFFTVHMPGEVLKNWLINDERR